MKLTPIFEDLIIEGALNTSHLVVVDIQPEYINGFRNWLSEFITFINKNYKRIHKITLLFNGPDLGMISEDEYRSWLYESGLKENIVYNIYMYDKGYAFFRYCIDSGIDHESTTNLVRFMYNNHINDSRDLTEEFWSAFIKEYGNQDIRELLEFSDDAINIPDLMSELSKYGPNIILCGGAREECMKEVEIALDALNKKYEILNKFTY